MTNAVLFKAPERITEENAKRVEKDILNLAGEDRPILVIDASEMRFLSCSGIRTIVRVRTRFGGIAIRNASKEIRDVLDVVGLSESLNVETVPGNPPEEK